MTSLTLWDLNPTPVHQVAGVAEAVCVARVPACSFVLHVARMDT